MFNRKAFKVPLVLSCLLLLLLASLCGCDSVESSKAATPQVKTYVPGGLHADDWTYCNEHFGIKFPVPDNFAMEPLSDDKCELSSPTGMPSWLSTSPT